MAGQNELDDLIGPDTVRAAELLHGQAWRNQAWKRYLAAVLIAALTFALLFVVSRFAASTYPLLAYLTASAITAHLFGFRAALLTALLGFIVSWYSFIVPINAFKLGSATVVAFLAYGAATTLVIGLIASLQKRNAQLAIERRANQVLAENRELLFRELQHRVGNNLQMVSAMLSLQRRGLSGEAATALDRAARRVQTIGTIQRNLYNHDGGAIMLGALVEKVCREAVKANGRDDVALTFVGDADAVLEPSEAIPATVILAETVGNAIEHGLAGKSGSIAVSTRIADGHATIEVVDDGGMLPPDFAINQSPSLGLRLAGALAKQLRGSYSLQGTAEHTRACLTFPLQT
jgi:two-component sensor histidine kinase